MDIEKRKRDIEDWIGRPCENPSSNKDEEAEGKEEDVSTPQASTEDNSPIDEYEEGLDYDREDDHEDTRLLDEKNPRKKLHRGTKANRRRRIRRILTTKMMMMTEPVPRTTPDTATTTATSEVIGIPAPEEAPRNRCGS